MNCQQSSEFKKNTKQNNSITNDLTNRQTEARPPRDVRLQTGGKSRVSPDCLDFSINS